MIMNSKKTVLPLFVLFVFALSAGCASQPVEFEVSREVEVEQFIEVEVTREVMVEVEVPQVVIVTPVSIDSETESPRETTDETAADTTSNPEPVVEAVPADQPSTLRLAHELIWAGDEVLDPYAATRFAEYSLLAHERLVKLDGAGNIAPVLATGWESNGDGTVWTFALRDDVVFHNGQPMRPADVAYSLERMIDPTIGSTLQPVLQQMASITVDGNNQIVIGLSAPNVEFPMLLTDPRAVILQADDGGAPAADEIGTGPFALESLNIEGITQLLAHVNYWGGRPGVDQVELIAIPDSATRIDAMLAEQIDILDRIPNEQKTQFANANEFGLQSIPTGDWRGFAMRTDTAPFDNAAVRQAIRLAADRQGLVDAVLGGAGTVACDTPVWSGDRYHKPIECGQDLEQAKALLATAGYPNGIDLTIRTSPLDPYWPALLAVYQQQATPAGIRLNIVEEPAETFWTNTWLIEPFITTSWNERPAPLILNEAWRSGAPWNETYWNNADFDALLDQAAAEPDLSLRRGFYWQAQQTLWDSGGAFIPFHLNQTRVISTCIAGVQPISAEHIDFAKIVKTPNCN